MKEHLKMVMKRKAIRKILISIIVILFGVFAFSVIIFPIRTLNRILADISKIEFKLMAGISSWLPEKPDPDGAILILASHRGLVKKGSVENSHQSIKDSLESGFRSIEIDISFSADFIPFVFHGPDLAPVGREGQISDFSSMEIKGFRLENGQSLLTLKDFCRLYAAKFDRIYLDIKGDNANYEQKARMIIQAITDYGSDNIVLIGYPWTVMKAVKKVLPHIIIGIEQKGAIANFILNGNMVSLNYKHEFSFAEYKLAKLLGLDVVTWTVNDFELLKQYSKIYRMEVLTDLNVHQNFL